MSPKNHSIRFGEFVLDGGNFVFTSRGQPAALTPKALDLLSVLIENRGRLVTKNELIERVWAGSFVEEGNLAYTIRLLRKALDDDASSPKYIESIPKRGYRFIAHCHQVGNLSDLAIFPSQTTGEETDAGLIGRAKEIADIQDLLRKKKVRLVTLTGPGGTGKTRLAKELAILLDEDFSDGVVFVDLTTLADPLLVVPEIALQFGITEVGTNPIAVVSDYLRERETLLILDNFEQVVSAGVQLVEILQRTSGVKLLVTSREPLKITVELEYRVPPLELPSAGASQTITDLMRFGAVRLFVERARDARPDLVLGESDAEPLSGICQTLDGLPLALELAASRAKVLSIHEIFSKLEDRLALLTGGSRDMPNRQQTVRATIEWSFGLLNGLEKKVFLLLSVFEGGFTFKAAESVLRAVDKSISKADIVNAVTSLTEKNLLLSQPSLGGEIRFRMLVVVRDYALEERAARVDEDTLRRSHAEYCLKLTETGVPFLFSFESPQWLNRFAVEEGNIRAALRWSLDHDRQLAARILASIRHLAAIRMHTSQTRLWLEEILEHADEISPEVRCELVTGLGIVCQYQRDLKTARNIHEENLRLCRQIGDQKLVARALRGLGAIDYMEMRLESGRRLLNEALETSRLVNDEFGEAAALARLGDISNAERDYSQARNLITEALEIFGRLGYKQGVSSKLSNISITEFESGNYEAARAYLLRALEVCVEIDDQIDFPVNFEVAAAILVDAAEYQTAARLAGAAAAKSEQMAYFNEPVEQRFRETYLAKLRDAMSESDFQAAFMEGKRMAILDVVELALRSAKKPQSNRRGLHLIGPGRR